MRAANLALRFLLELAALALLVTWGLSLDASLALRLLAGLGAAAVFAALWGAVVAPKARRRLADPAKLVVELVLFGAATAAALASSHTTLAIVFAALVVVNEALLFTFDQRAY